MLRDSTKDEAIAPEATRHDPRMRPAIATSLLLHAGLALALVRGTLTPSGLPDSPIDAPAVRVTVVTESPQRRAPPQAPDIQEEPEAPQIEIAEVPPEVEPVVEASTEDAANTPETTLPVADAVPPADARSESDTAAEAEITLDLERLQESISGSMLTYRRDLLEQQMNECQQYRARYARWDCPQASEIRPPELEQFDGMGITGPRSSMLMRYFIYAPESRESIELRSEMSTLRSLMEDGGVQGELARQRYSINAERFCTLNPKLCEPGSTASKYSRFAGDPQ